MAQNPSAFAADTAANKNRGAQETPSQKKYSDDIEAELEALKKAAAQGQPPPPNSSFGSVPPFNQGRVNPIPSATTPTVLAEDEKEILRTSCRPWDSAYINLDPTKAPVPAFASVKKSCAGMNKETVSLADINSCIFGTQPPSVQPSDNFKKCYRFRSKVVHPDLHPGVGQPQEYTKAFQLLSKAYTSLERFKVR